MPVSSFEIATTAAPYFFTSGRTVYEPVFLAGHRVRRCLALVEAASPAASAATIEESIDSGTSVID